MATGFELEVITIVLLGGVSIFGGRGRMSGVLLAVLIVLNLRNGLGLANVGGNAQIGVIGGDPHRLGARARTSSSGGSLEEAVARSGQLPPACISRPNRLPPRAPHDAARLDALTQRQPHTQEEA